MSPLFGAHTSSSPWVSIPIYGVANLSLAHTRHPGGALDFAASHPNNANRYTIFLPKVCSDPLTSLFLGPLTQTTATSSLGGELAKPVFPNQLLSQPVCSLSFFFFSEPSSGSLMSDQATTSLQTTHWLPKAPRTKSSFLIHFEGPTQPALHAFSSPVCQVRSSFWASPR